jgi:hypothetical protein
MLGPSVLSDPSLVTSGSHISCGLAALTYLSHYILHVLFIQLRHARFLELFSVTNHYLFCISLYVAILVSKDEMGRACGTCEKRRRCVQDFGWRPNAGLGVDRNIKMII